MTHQKLTSVQRDRAAGVLFGQACGDALGVPYEFGPPLGDATPAMVGGGLGPYAPGEWSDDTQMAICVARVTAAGPLDDRGLGRIVRAFQDWLDDGASDVGNQTRAVLTAARHIFTSTPIDMDGGGLDKEWFWAALDAAGGYTEHHERSAGNGALMRNGIVGLTALHDRDATAQNARNVARLTHADPLVLDSCVLHAEAVRHAVMTGEYDLLAGLDLIPEERRPQWTEWIETATLAEPSTIEANGSTFGALRAAHAAITSMHFRKYSVHQGGSRIHVQSALEAAVGAGHDTDTVAAIAGALLGALYGVSSIPGTWRRRIHGWPAMTARDLVELALRTAGEAQPDTWPLRESEPSPGGRALDVPAPFDNGLYLGTQTALARTRADAVVSLSRIGSHENLDHHLRRIGRAEYPARHLEYWIVDSDDKTTHNDVAGALEDAADVIAELRAEGHTVFLHCVHAHHRTPSVALLYAVKHCGLDADEAAEQICATLGVDHIDGLLWSTAMRAAERITVARQPRGPKGWYDNEFAVAGDLYCDLSPVMLALHDGNITHEEYAVYYERSTRKRGDAPAQTWQEPND